MIMMIKIDIRPLLESPETPFLWRLVDAADRELLRDVAGNEQQAIDRSRDAAHNLLESSDD